MANERLNIPEKLKVGFQEREGTYSGKLAYIVYLNKKGNIAKEASWGGWIDSKIPTEEYDNVPTEGFVLNKKVGDYTSEWGHRHAYCRVYDPRGFEFEIGFENLLYILENCNSTKGKGLEGEFVYAWDGKDLVLLPVCSPDYVATKALQEKSEELTARDLKVGGLYRAKSYQTVNDDQMDYVSFVYLGKFKFNLEGKKYFLFYCEKTKKIHTYSGIAHNFDYCIDEEYYSQDKIADIADLINNDYSIRGTEGGFKKLYIDKAASKAKEITSMEEANKVEQKGSHHFLIRTDDKTFMLLDTYTEKRLNGMNANDYELGFYEKYNSPYIIENLRRAYSYYGYYRDNKPVYSPKRVENYVKSIGITWEGLLKEYFSYRRKFENESKYEITGFYPKYVYRLTDDDGFEAIYGAKRKDFPPEIGDMPMYEVGYDIYFVAEYNDGKKTRVCNSKGVVTITNNLPKNLI